MADLLSSVSLLFAIIGVLYRLWYSELKQALDTPVSDYSKDNVEPLNIVSLALWKRAVPLFVASGILGIIYLPEVIRIMIDSGANYWDKGCSGLKDYSAVETSFCLATCFVFVFTLHIVLIMIRLFSLCKQLKGL